MRVPEAEVLAAVRGIPGPEAAAALLAKQVKRQLLLLQAAIESAGERTADAVGRAR